MTIRPVDVRRKEFKNSLRGYDANQVDDFLDTVADEFERTFAENQRLTEEIKSLKERLEQFEELETSIREALVHAQQVSNDVRRNANKEAELILREAKERSHQILADSSARVERVQESYEVLRKAKQDFANDFRHLLKSYIAVMDNADVASAKEIESSLRERLDLESVAAAREAAETRRVEQGRDEREHDEPERGTLEREEPTVEVEDIEQEPAQRMEVAETPSGAMTTPAPRPLAPEVEEPEVDPSSTENPARQGDAFEEAATTPKPETAEEVDHEEPMPAEEGHAYDEFFGEGRERPGKEDAEERKRFRASRFLRRRG